MRPIFIMKGKFVKLMSLSINRETKNLASPSSKLFSDRIKTAFCKVCLECGRSRLAFLEREDVAIGKVNKFLRDVLLWSRSVLLLLAPTTRKCDSSQ